jgi:hypothetical protein
MYGPGGVAYVPTYVVVSSPPSTEEIEAMGREIDPARVQGSNFKIVTCTTSPGDCRRKKDSCLHITIKLT